MREASYHGLALLMQSLGPHFYSVPGIGERLTSSLFHDAMYLTNVQWKSLLNMVIKPLILECPAQYFVNALTPFCSPLFSFLTGKLDQEWQSIQLVDE
jgi:hypothetical protein